jgi:hypothetical protein
MQQFNERRSNFQLRNASHSPYTFQLRQVRLRRRKPRWRKPLFYIFAFFALSIILGPIAGLIFFFVAFTVGCSRSQKFVVHSDSSPNQIREVNSGLQASSISPAFENPAQTPEQIGHSIRGAGGIINYINYRN